MAEKQKAQDGAKKKKDQALLVLNLSILRDQSRKKKNRQANLKPLLRIRKPHLALL